VFMPGKLSWGVETFTALPSNSQNPDGPLLTRSLDLLLI
jgi:hypothetical protein